MYLKCECGNVMNNVGSPNSFEHFLLSDSAKEKLQNAVDEEVEKEGQTDMWTEHWENAGTVDVWKCDVCQRLYFNPDGNLDNIIVYQIEKIGLST